MLYIVLEIHKNQYIVYKYLIKELFHLVERRKLMCKCCEPQDGEYNFFCHKLNYKDFSGRWGDISIEALQEVFLTFQNNKYTLDIDVGYDGYDCDGTHSIENLPIHECPICGRNF